MQFLKQKLVFKQSATQNIQINLTENVNLSGLQENINDFVTEEIGLSVNDVTDKETFRFIPSTYTWWLAFYSTTPPTGYTIYLTGATFTSTEISTKDQVLKRSFYIVQIYDKVESESQTLLHTGYFNGYDFLEKRSTTQYDMLRSDEVTNLYLPQWFIESLSGQTTTIYGKVSFYNAKTGKLHLFSVTPIGSYSIPTTESDLYYTMFLDPNNFSYSVSPPTFYCWEMTNTDYVDKINNTLDSFDNEKPTYPTGNTFTNTGNYIET